MDIKFLRRSLQSRGRYIKDQLHEAKGLLRELDEGQVPSDKYSDCCEKAISFKEQLSVKIDIYSQYFQDLHRQVVPLCIGDNAEEERHNVEYDNYVDLKDSCDETIAKLQSFISVLRFRMEMEYTLSQSETDRKVPVNPGKPDFDKLLSDISNMALREPGARLERPPEDSVKKTLKFSPAVEQSMEDAENMILEDPFSRAGADAGVPTTAPTLYATSPAGDVIRPTVIPPYPGAVSRAEAVTQTVSTPESHLGAPIMSSTENSQENKSETKESNTGSGDLSDWLVPMESVHVSEEKFMTPFRGGVDRSWLSSSVNPSESSVRNTYSIQPVIPSIFVPSTQYQENFTSHSVAPPVSDKASWLLPESDSSGKKDESHDKKAKDANHDEKPKDENNDEDSEDVTNDARLLTRVPVPHFKGNKRQYEGWKAAFVSLVDKTKLSVEHKVLRLHETLEGDPKRMIVNLGYSKTAYNTALKRLEKKYGGSKRRVKIRMEDLDAFRQVKDNNEKDLEDLAELLDVLVVNLTEAGDEAELRSTSLFLNVQKKLTKTLLCKFEEWMHMNNKKEDLESLREFIDQQAEYLSRASEALKGVTQETKNKGRNQQTFVTTEQSTTSNTFYTSPTPGDSGCAHCKKGHPIWKCKGFKKLKPDEKLKRVRELKLCFLCLGAHYGRSCDKEKQPCGIDQCDKMHNRLLHGAFSKPPPYSPPPGGATPRRQDGATGGNHSGVPETGVKSPFSDAQPNPGEPKGHVTTLTTLSTGKSDSDVISLRTVSLHVNNGDKSMKINVILDDCSTTTYINSDVTSELDIECEAEDISVGVLNGNRAMHTSSLVEVEIESLDGKLRKKISAYTMENVTGNLQVKDWNKIKRQFSHLKDIPFQKVDKSKRKIDMLIGADNCDLIYSIKEVVGLPGEPIARLTPLGWTCIGPTDNKKKSTHFSFFTMQPNPEESQVAQILKKCWEIEEPKMDYPQKTVDEEVKQKTQESLEYDESTYRYTVGVPWTKLKMERKTLPDTRKVAERRLRDTEKKLNKQPGLRDAYGGILKKYEQKGYIRKVPTDEKDPEMMWLLGHFAVIKLNRLTTKVRICFDSAQKVEGISLNDLIHPGPKLQNDIDEVLIHMRKHMIVLMADVSEMYYQIDLKPEDRPFFRFLWRESEDEPPAVYEFQRVFFGMNAAPFLAHLVSQHHARVNQDSLPLAAETVLKHTYMDDNLDCIPSVAQGVMLYKQLCTFWNTCGMKPHKWVSNSRELLKEIPAADIIPTFDLDRDEMPGTKTLGALWKPKEDILTFESKEVDDVESITKRSFLHHTMSLFDPLGILAPYTIQAKVLLQEMWAKGLSWDEEIPMDLRQEVTKWYSELRIVPEMTLNRCLRKDESVVKTQVHMFCDASTEAYGACVYTRHTYQDGQITCTLTKAKGKVCPLRAVSVPRLELMSALEGVKLMIKVAAALEVPPAEWFMWTDSMDVLHWVKGRSRQYKPFVSHRVGEIQHYTEPERWRHVPSQLNPADIITRGRSVSQLKDDEMWSSGPPFLLEDEEEWPKTKMNNTHELKEMKKAETFSSYLEPVKVYNRLDPKNYSSLTRMCRVMAWIHRFMNNAKIHDEENRDSGPLRPDEITMAENKYLVTCQHEEFTDEMDKLRKEKPISGKLSALNPFLDEDGLLRCNGRLAYADTLPWETRFPIILPSHHSLTELIVKHAHEELQHGGTNHVLHSLSSNYWILSAREEIRRWEHKCNMCKRRKQSPNTQIMAPLPRCRSAKSMKAFTLVSLDFAGPIKTKQGRGKARLNRYICVFTCLECRAAHLEVCYSLSTDSFLMSLSRMTDRRGVMSDIWCDNGTNFLGAKNELEALEKQRDVMDKTAHRKITWHFQPPAAPHFSGVHERIVQSAKRAVYAILNSADVTDEELHTAVAGAEKLINSRPLTYQSSNSDDIIPLTPNHFLTNQMGGDIAPTEIVDNTDYSLKKRWRRVQELNRHFWSRWMTEWLPSLQGRKKWKTEQDNLSIGDVVLVVSPDTPRGSWPLGRVTQTFPGQDGKVRVCELKVKDKLLRRPVVKLCKIT